MIKINVFQMNHFLQTVNGCIGPVYVYDQYGKKGDIRTNYGIQADLMKKHRQNKGVLRLSLDIPVPGDYMDIVCFSIGEC